MITAWTIAAAIDMAFKFYEWLVALGCMYHVTECAGWLVGASES